MKQTRSQSSRSNLLASQNFSPRYRRRRAGNPRDLRKAVSFHRCQDLSRLKNEIIS